MNETKVERIFRNDGAEWSAMREAEHFVRSRGWSIGPTDITQVRGILFEAGVRIAKWKNLTDPERAECDATLRGSNRFGDLVLRSETGWA